MLPRRPARASRHAPERMTRPCSLPRPAPARPPACRRRCWRPPGAETAASSWSSRAGSPPAPPPPASPPIVGEDVGGNSRLPRSQRNARLARDAHGTGHRRRLRAHDPGRSRRWRDRGGALRRGARARRRHATSASPSPWTRRPRFATTCASSPCRRRSTAAASPSCSATRRWWRAKAGSSRSRRVYLGGDAATRDRGSRRARRAQGAAEETGSILAFLPGQGEIRAPPNGLPASCRPT